MGLGGQGGNSDDQVMSSAGLCTVTARGQLELSWIELSCYDQKPASRLATLWFTREGWKLPCQQSCIWLQHQAAEPAVCAVASSA